MQKFSKEELQEQAEKFMAAHKVDSFLATEDGNFFHPKDISLARDHNAKNVNGEVYEYEAPKEVEPIPHVITQDDLDNNEGLADQVSIGDEVVIPAEDEISIDPADAVMEEEEE